VLADAVLADAVLADAVLADAVLADAVLADAGGRLAEACADAGLAVTAGPGTDRLAVAAWPDSPWAA